MFKSINRTAAALARRAAYFHTTSLVQAASVFNMPAMSPTMTEGGVVSWKLKPGEAFSAGDVLLEVETDKATIDVEAQDDGVMWEILVQEGAKEVPVGKPIALLAEPGDDLSTLEKPALDEPATKKQEKPKEENKTEGAPKPAEKETSSVKAESKSEKPSSGLITKADRSQKLLPSVELLLHKNGISESDAYEKIPASGPHGRILKGDVLAYLGEINSEAVSKVAEFINARSHLDLLNIQLAEPAPKKEEQPKPKEEKAKPSNIVSIKVTCDLGEDVSHEKFRYAFDRAVETSVKQTYGRRFPQYSRNPTSSGTSSQEDIFDDLLVAPVSKKRFEVYDVQYQFEKAQTAALDAFDELLGLKATRTPLQPETVTKIDVVVTIKVDDTVADARDFVDQFKHNLVLQVPSKHLVIE